MMLSTNGELTNRAAANPPRPAAALFALTTRPAGYGTFAKTNFAKLQSESDNQVVKCEDL